MLCCTQWIFKELDISHADIWHVCTFHTDLESMTTHWACLPPWKQMGWLCHDWVREQNLQEWWVLYCSVPLPLKANRILISLWSEPTLGTMTHRKTVPRYLWLHLPCYFLEESLCIIASSIRAGFRASHLHPQHSQLFFNFTSSTLMEQFTIKDGEFLDTVTVSVSCGCSNKLVQTWWLQTTQMYSLLVLEVRILKWVSANIKVPTGLCSFWRLWGSIGFLVFSSF